MARLPPAGAVKKSKLILGAKQDPLVKCKKFSVTFATFLITRRLGII